MAAKAPSFQWYPKDCDTDENVRLMDDAEFGFFVRALNHSWLNEGLPQSLDDISRLLSRPRRMVEKYWKRVGCCFVLAGGRWRNPKQEEQRASARDFSEVRRKAAETRWGKVDANAYANAQSDALHMECPAAASSTASASAYTAAADASGKVHMHAWPLAAAAVGRKFPLADADIVAKIADAASAVDPGISDEQLAQVIEFAYKRTQKSPGLFLRTVPAVIRNTRAKPRDSTEDHESEAAESQARDLYANGDDEMRAELRKLWPEIAFEGGQNAENRTA